jgi:hypothetical protein
MGLLDKIQSGRQRKPITACVYGVPGVGKTTFGASAPNPLVCCLERGADGLDVAKLPAPESWESFVGDLRELANTDHGFKTLVVDTLDALEVLAVQYVCQKGGKPTLADFSWGAGYALLTQEWRLFLKALEFLRDKRGMNIVLIAHEHRKAFADPELGSFEMYRPKLQDKVWALTNEWCDAVLFAQFDQALLEKDGQKARAIVSGRRILRTQRGTGYVAKNRFGLPDVIDLDWKTFEAAAQPVPVDVLKTKLGDLLAKANPDVQAKAKAYLAERGETPETLRALTERVQTILAEKAA